MEKYRRPKKKRVDEPQETRSTVTVPTQEQIAPQQLQPLESKQGGHVDPFLEMERGYDPELRTFHAPLYWPELQQVLTEEEYNARSNIVVVGGIPVAVENILDAIHGREFFPILSTAEILHIADENGGERSGNQWTVDYMHNNGIITDITNALTRARTKKQRAIQALIQQSTIDFESLLLPNRAAIMLAIAEGDMRHVADVTEFLGSIIQLTHADAQEAANTQQEVVGNEALASRPVDARSAVNIREYWLAPEVREFAEALGINEMELYNVPETVLERVVNRHPLTDEDIRQIRHLSTSGIADIQLPVTLEGAGIPAGMMVSLSSMLATGFVSVASAPVLSSVLIAGGLAGIGISIGSGIVSVSGKQPLTNLLRKFVLKGRVKKMEKQLRQQRQQLESAVRQLEQSALGKLQLRSLQESMKVRTGVYRGVRKQDLAALRQWVMYFKQHPMEAQRLEEVVELGHATDFDGSGVWQVIESYQHKVEADKELE